MSQAATKEQQQQQAPAQGGADGAIEKRRDTLVGSYYQADEVDRRLRSIASGGRYHLVAPAPVCGSLTMGYEAAVSVVQVDVEHETYETGGDDNVGLSKVALDKIAGAAGIEAIPALCKRLDDGSDPHYCHYRWVGRVRNFDGSWRPLMDEKEMDLREGSPQVKSLAKRSTNKIRRDYEKRKQPVPANVEQLGREKADNQITEMRLHILGHAITKARLRAIRGLGVRTGYKAQELAKPFVVIGVRFTGRSENPEIQKMFAQRIMENALPSVDAMFGASERRLPAGTHEAVPTQFQVDVPHAPPPVGARRRGEDDDIEDADYEAQPQQQQAAAGAPAQQQPQPQPDGNGGQTGAGARPVFKFGNDKGMPLEDAADEDIDWYVKALRKSVRDPVKEKYKAQNERDLNDAIAEQKRRKAAERDDDDDGDDGDEDEDAPAGGGQQEGLKLGGRRRS